MTQILLASKSDPGRSETVSPERLVNAFAERNPSDAKGAFAVYRSPGLAFLSGISSDLCRSLFVLDGVMLALYGQALIPVDDNFAAGSSYGSISGSDTPIVARNMKATPQVVYVVDAGVRVLESGSITTLSDGDLPTPNSVDSFKQRFVFGIDDGRVFWSDLNATTINALNFLTAEGDPDGLVRVKTFGDQVVLFGRNTTEFMVASSSDDTAFEVLPGAKVELGLIGKHAVCSVGGRLYWIDQYRRLQRLGPGYTSERVSNNGIERALAQLSADDTIGPEDVELWGYVSGGHTYLVIWTRSFTWVFDAATEVPGERQTNRKDYWQARRYAFFSDRHVVASDLSGGLYELDDDTYTEGEEPQVFEMITPIAANFPAGAVIDRLDIDMEFGQSPTYGFEPQVMVSFSFDCGKTFGDERLVSLGDRGKYRRRGFVSRIGKAGREGLCVKLRCSDPVKLAIMKMDITARRRAA